MNNIDVAVLHALVALHSENLMIIELLKSTITDESSRKKIDEYVEGRNADMLRILQDAVDQGNEMISQLSEQPVE